jgi:hypothetical protein
MSTHPPPKTKQTKTKNKKTKKQRNKKKYTKIIIKKTVKRMKTRF